jgi:hypothetical protein
MTAEGPPGVYRRKLPVFSNLRFLIDTKFLILNGLLVNSSF